MQNKLAAIIHNLMEAKDLLANADPNNADIKNVEGENKYAIGAMESFSKRLLQNIELTLKNKQA